MPESTNGELANDLKFRELILLISEKSEGDHPFGATKLNKLMFFADFVAYVRFGKSITGHRYQKLKNGPAPRALLPVLDRMKADNDVAVVERNYYGKTQNRTKAIKDPDLSVFSGPEVELVLSLISDFWGKNATEMSLESHRFIGWKLARDGEDIPFQVSLVGRPHLTAQIKSAGAGLEARAKELLAQHA